MKESTKAYLVDIYNSIPKKNKGYLLKNFTINITMLMSMYILTHLIIKV
mgnify:CR=1 FL=1